MVHLLAVCHWPNSLGARVAFLSRPTSSPPPLLILRHATAFMYFVGREGIKFWAAASPGIWGTWDLGFVRRGIAMLHFLCTHWC